VLTLSNPPIETIAGPGDAPSLARVANDELKKICETRPDKFPAWVASLPLNNVQAELEKWIVSLPWRARDPDLHQRQWPAARRSRVPPDLRACDKPPRGPDLDASGARRSGGRLPR
jgi:hypothetical protein